MVADVEPEDGKCERGEEEGRDLEKEEVGMGGTNGEAMWSSMARMKITRLRRDCRFGKRR